MLTVVGVGPAGVQLMTPAARQAVAEAEILIGGKRHLAQFPDFCGETRQLDADIAALLSWIECQTARRVVVLASGDPLFYGIGTRMVAHFGIDRLKVIPGISAAQYLCAKTGIDMNDIWLTSSHGRTVDFEVLVRQPKVAMVTDKLCGPREIAAELVARGAGQRRLVIGENLAMENERIHWLRACDVTAQYDMNVLVILNER